MAISDSSSSSEDDLDGLLNDLTPRLRPQANNNNHNNAIGAPPGLPPPTATEHHDTTGIDLLNLGHSHNYDINNRNDHGGTSSPALIGNIAAEPTLGAQGNGGAFIDDTTAPAPPAGASQAAPAQNSHPPHESKGSENSAGVADYGGEVLRHKQRDER
jgi:hypothetical protein